MKLGSLSSIIASVALTVCVTTAVGMTPDKLTRPIRADDKPYLGETTHGRSRLKFDADRHFTPYVPGAPHAAAVGVFSEDKSVNVFVGIQQYCPKEWGGKSCVNFDTAFNAPQYQSDFEFWRFDDNNAPVEKISSTKGCLHPRQVVVADFNRDGVDDAFVACIGFDGMEAFKLGKEGEQSKLLLSNAKGKFDLGNATPKGYFHGAAGGDVNGDGFPDLVVADLMSKPQVYFLINQKNGKFIKDTTRISGLAKGNYWTTKLIDVDGDGILDLIAGGSEGPADPGSSVSPEVFFGDKEGTFGKEKMSIPTIKKRGSISDYEVITNANERVLYVARTTDFNDDLPELSMQTIQAVNLTTGKSSVLLDISNPQNTGRAGRFAHGDGAIKWFAPASRDGQRGVAPFNRQVKDFFVSNVQIDLPKDLATGYKGPDLKGETLTIACPWWQFDKGNFQEVVKAFEAATGVVVKISCSRDSDQQIIDNIKTGTPTNISLFPNPRRAANMGAIDGLVPLGDNVSDLVKKNFANGQSWVNLGTYSNKAGKKELFGVFYNVHLDGLVWYVPENFKNKRYAVPKTMEELQNLTVKMAADGAKPWCIGLGDDAGTGWPAKRWVEDLMLRMQPPETYDDWISNKIKFNDERVVEVIDAYGWFSKNDAYVAGGAKAIAKVSSEDSPMGLFGSPPKCYMHHQNSWILGPLPESMADQADFFYFPSFADKKLGNPILVSGAIMTITKDSKAARAWMEFIMHPQASEIWISDGDFFLSPLKTVDVNKYMTKQLKRQAEMLLSASAIRIGASDMMPRDVGINSGSFSKGMINFASGQSAKEVADEIQKSWDAIK